MVHVLWEKTVKKRRGYYLTALRAIWGLETKRMKYNQEALGCMW